MEKIQNPSEQVLQTFPQICNTQITRRLNLQVTKKDQFVICKIQYAGKDKEKPPSGTGETGMNC